MVPSCNWQKYSHSQFIIIISLYWNNVFTYVDSVRNFVVLSQRLPLTSLVSDMCNFKGLWSTLGKSFQHLSIYFINRVEDTVVSTLYSLLALICIQTLTLDDSGMCDDEWEGRRWENCSHSLVSQQLLNLFCMNTSRRTNLCLGLDRLGNVRPCLSNMCLWI